jgi:hypothetical protein
MLGRRKCKFNTTSCSKNLGMYSSPPCRLFWRSPCRLFWIFQAKYVRIKILCLWTDHHTWWGGQTPEYELCFVRVLNIDACGQALKHRQKYWPRHDFHLRICKVRGGGNLGVPWIPDFFWEWGKVCAFLIGGERMEPTTMYFYVRIVIVIRQFL